MIKRNRLMASALAVLAIASSGYGIKANAATTDATTATTATSTTTTGSAATVSNNGWVKGVDGAHRGTWYFYENGNKVTGEKFIDGNHYFFDKDGAFTTDAWVVNGVLTDNLEPQFKNNTHYYDCNGMQARGWCRMEKSYVNGRGDWMYFDENGIQQKGWVMSNHNFLLHGYGKWLS